MLGAVIRNGNNTLVIDLPTGMMDLQTKLSSIGIQETSDKIKLSDEDGDKCTFVSRRLCFLKSKIYEIFLM